MKVTVLGVGAWGTALGKLLHEGQHNVTLWGHNPQHLDQIRRTGQNEPYLPGIALPRDWRLETDPTKAVHDSECVVVAVPSKRFVYSSTAASPRARTSARIAATRSSIA